MAIDVSIVTGTYNRLPHLKRMIESARASCAGVHGFRYEFVLVDGGSQDGTLEWLAGQPDCRVIEHGQLLGAVRAFNDGAAAARGDYVVLANDDVTFVGDSVPRAWAMMRERPDAGVGCFYQDRNGRDWHVEEMHCQVDGRPAHLPYGQVAIVPRPLGNRLGWWGDYLRTYGGDNELSANCYEAGYKVVPLEGCRIHDMEVDDDLRRLNNIDGAKDPRAVRGHNPDSWAWGRKWRKGPVVRSEPLFAIPPPSAKERVVYLPIYEQGWPVQKEQKRGLREALARVGAVVEVDYVGEAAAGGEAAMVQAAGRAVEVLRPTLCLFQLHGPDPMGPDHVAFLRAQAPEGCWFVNWNGDFWPENLLSEGGVGLARSFDLQLTVNRDALERYGALGVRAAYWQIGWEPDGVGHDPRPEDRCDVVFLANGYSQARRAFVRRLRGLPWNLRLWGNGWPEGWAVGQSTYDFVSACRAYRGARFSIGDSQWPETGFVSNRVMQALAAGGAALCHQWFRGMEALGLEDGVTCVVWREFGELADKLAYYAGREEHRAAIAAAGERLALERHSFDARVGELLAMRPLGGKDDDLEDWR